MNPDALDSETIDQFLNDVGSAARELLTLFVNETRTRLERMESLVEAADWPVLTSEAHSLKSSAATYGLEGLSAVAKELEQASRDGDVELARQHMALISKNTEGVLKALVETVETRLAD